MKRTALLLLSVPLLLFTSEAGANGDETVSYREFSFPGAGVTATYVSDLNNNGEMSGFYYHGSGESWAINDYFHTGNTFSRIDLSIAGGYSASLPPHANFFVIQAMNDKREFVGHYSRVDGHDYYSFYYDGETYKKIVIPDTHAAYVSDLNNSGQVIGNYISAGQFEQGPFPYYKGFIYDMKTDSYATMRYPGADFTYITAGNDNGQLVGFYGNYGDDSNAFLYDNSTWITLAGFDDYAEIYPKI